jgi:hypothetical protein
MSYAPEFHSDNEVEYLQLHVCNLEVIICELLAKNERLRRDLQPFRHRLPTELTQSEKNVKQMNLSMRLP